MGELRAVMFDVYLTLMYEEETGTREKVLDTVARAGLTRDEWMRSWSSTQESSYRGELPTVRSRVSAALSNAGHDDPEGRLADQLTGLLMVREFRALYPDARACLDELRNRSYRLAVLSNITADEAHWNTHYELGDYFDACVLSYEVGLIKPEPAFYLRAAESLGVGPDGCVFVDDVPSYVAAAKAVGMTGVQITRPGVHPTREAEGEESVAPDLSIRELGELLEWLPARAAEA